MIRLPREILLFLRKATSVLLLLSFISGQLLPPAVSFAQASSILNLPLPGAMVGISPSYVPIIIKGIKIFPDNPFRFDFLLDTGHTNLDQERLNEETKLLIKYFLTALTIPDEDQWVNLSPYEKDRIIPNEFGITEMGRDLLAQDYLLKQLTASLVYPEHELGKKFWENVYKKAYEKYGDADIPVSTFNKVWIMPDHATVYQHANTAVITESRLKVLLEEDYLALAKGAQESQGPSDPLAGTRGAPESQSPSDPERLGTGALETGEPKEMNSLGSQIIRDIVLPEIEREINEGKNFAKLRQIYHSMIMAAWYKRKLKDSFLNKIYVGKNKVVGVDVEDKEIKQKIYEQYLEAFKKGVYNYIREDVDSRTQEVIPRKYFSGGMKMAMNVGEVVNYVTAASEQAATAAALPNMVGSLKHVTSQDLPVDAKGAVLGDKGALSAAPQPQPAGDRAVLSLELKEKASQLIDFVKSAKNKELAKGGTSYQYALFWNDQSRDEKSVPARLRNQLQEIQNPEEIKSLARALKEEWINNGFDQEVAPFFEYVAYIFSDYMGKPSQIKEAYEWLYTFLDAADPWEKAYALRIMIIGFINHMRNFGFHPENKNAVLGLFEGAIPVDVESLIGNQSDRTGKQIFQRYILSLLELKDTPQWTDVLPDSNGQPNKLGLTHEDMLLWALNLLVDPTIYFEGIANYSVEEMVAYLSKYLDDEDVTADNAGIKFLQRAFGHESLKDKKIRIQIEDLLIMALSVSDQKWQELGQRSPFNFALNNDNLMSVLASPFFWGDQPRRVFSNRFLKLGFDFYFWPESSKVLLKPSADSKRHPVLMKQKEQGLKPLFIKAFTSTEMAAIFPRLAQHLRNQAAEPQPAGDRAMRAQDAAKPESDVNIELRVFNEQIQYSPFDSANPSVRDQLITNILKSFNSTRSDFWNKVTAVSASQSEQLDGVLTHLVDNAVDAILERLDKTNDPDERQRIIERASIGLSYKVDSSSGKFEIILTDTGVGVSSELLEAWASGQWKSTKPSGPPGERPYQGRRGWALPWRVLPFITDYRITFLTRSLEGSITHKYTLGEDRVEDVPSENSRQDIGTDVSITGKITSAMTANSSGGGMKALSVFDATRPEVEPTDAIKTLWKVRAAPIPAQKSLTIKNFTFKDVKVIEAEDGELLPGSPSYYLPGDDGGIIIVISPKIQDAKIREELIFHEGRESQRFKQLFEERSVGGKVLSPEDIKTIRRDSHILAWDDQILAFGVDQFSGEVSLTPFQKLQLEPSSPWAIDREAIRAETVRDYQDALSNKYFPEEEYQEYFARYKEKFQEGLNDIAEPSSAAKQETPAANSRLDETYKKLIALSANVDEWKTMNPREKWEERSDQWSLTKLIYSPGGIQKAGLTNADGTSVTADIRGNYPHWIYEFKNEYNDNVIYMGQDDMHTLFPGSDLLEDARVMRMEKEEAVKDNTRTIKTIAALQKLFGETEAAKSLLADIWDSKKGEYVPGDRHFDRINQVRAEFDELWQRDFSTEISLDRFLEIYADLSQAVKSSRRWGKLGYLSIDDQSRVAQIMSQYKSGVTLSAEDVKVLIKVHGIILDLKNSLIKEATTWAKRSTQQADDWVNPRRPAYHANIWIANWLIRAGLNKPIILDVGANSSVLWSILISLSPELAANIIDLEKDKDIFDKAPNPLKARADISDLSAGVETSDPAVSDFIIEPNSFDVITANFVLDQLKPAEVVGALKSFERLLAIGGRLILSMPKGSPLQGSEFEKVLLELGYRPEVQAANLSNQLTPEAEARIRQEDGEEYLKTVKATLTEKVFHVGIYQKTRQNNDEEIDRIDQQRLVIRSGEGRRSNGKGTNGFVNRFASDHVDLNDIFASLKLGDLLTGKIEIITKDELNSKPEYASLGKQLEMLAWLRQTVEARQNEEAQAELARGANQPKAPGVMESLPRLKRLMRIADTAAAISAALADENAAFVQADFVKEVMSVNGNFRFTLEQVGLLSENLKMHFEKVIEKDTAIWHEKNDWAANYQELWDAFKLTLKNRTYTLEQLFDVFYKKFQVEAAALLEALDLRAQQKEESEGSQEGGVSWHRFKGIADGIKDVETSVREASQRVQINKPGQKISVHDVAQELGTNGYWLNYLIIKRLHVLFSTFNIQRIKEPADIQARVELIKGAVSGLEEYGVSPTITNVQFAMGFEQVGILARWEREGLGQGVTLESLGVKRGGLANQMAKYTDEVLVDMIQSVSEELELEGIEPTRQAVVGRLEKNGRGSIADWEQVIDKLLDAGYKTENLGIASEDTEQSNIPQFSGDVGTSKWGKQEIFSGGYMPGSAALARYERELYLDLKKIIDRLSIDGRPVEREDLARELGTDVYWTNWLLDIIPKPLNAVKFNMSRSKWLDVQDNEQRRQIIRYATASFRARGNDNIPSSILARILGMSESQLQTWKKEGLLNEQVTWGDLGVGSFEQVNFAQFSKMNKLTRAAKVQEASKGLLQQFRRPTERRIAEILRLPPKGFDEIHKNLLEQGYDNKNLGIHPSMDAPDFLETMDALEVAVESLDKQGLPKTFENIDRWMASNRNDLHQKGWLPSSAPKTEDRSRWISLRKKLSLVEDPKLEEESSDLAEEASLDTDEDALTADEEFGVSGALTSINILELSRTNKDDAIKAIQEMSLKLRRAGIRPTKSRMGQAFGLTQGAIDHVIEDIKSVSGRFFENENLGILPHGTGTDTSLIYERMQQAANELKAKGVALNYDTIESWVSVFKSEWKDGRWLISRETGRQQFVKLGIVFEELVPVGELSGAQEEDASSSEDESDRVPVLTQVDIESLAQTDPQKAIETIQQISLKLRRGGFRPVLSRMSNSFGLSLSTFERVIKIIFDDSLEKELVGVLPRGADRSTEWKYYGEIDQAKQELKDRLGILPRGSGRDTAQMYKILEQAVQELSSKGISLNYDTVEAWISEHRYDQWENGNWLTSNAKGRRRLMRMGIAFEELVSVAQSPAAQTADDSAVDVTSDDQMVIPLLIGNNLVELSKTNKDEAIKTIEDMSLKLRQAGIRPTATNMSVWFQLPFGQFQGVLTRIGVPALGDSSVGMLNSRMAGEWELIYQVVQQAVQELLSDGNSLNYDSVESWMSKNRPEYTNGGWLPSHDAGRQRLIKLGIVFKKLVKGQVSYVLKVDSSSDGVFVGEYGPAQIAWGIPGSNKDSNIDDIVALVQAAINKANQRLGTSKASFTEVAKELRVDERWLRFVLAHKFSQLGIADDIKVPPQRIGRRNAVKGTADLLNSRGVLPTIKHVEMALGYPEGQIRSWYTKTASLFKNDGVDDLGIVEDPYGSLSGNLEAIFRVIRSEVFVRKLEGVATSLPFIWNESLMRVQDRILWLIDLGKEGYTLKAMGVEDNGSMGKVSETLSEIERESSVQKRGSFSDGVFVGEYGPAQIAWGIPGATKDSTFEDVLEIVAQAARKVMSDSGLSQAPISLVADELGVDHYWLSVLFWKKLYDLKIEAEKVHPVTSDDRRELIRKIATLLTSRGIMPTSFFIEHALGLTPSEFDQWLEQLGISPNNATDLAKLKMSKIYGPRITDAKTLFLHLRNQSYDKRVNGFNLRSTAMKEWLKKEVPGYDAMLRELMDKGYTWENMGYENDDKPPSTEITSKLTQVVWGIPESDKAPSNVKLSIEGEWNKEAALKTIKASVAKFPVKPGQDQAAEVAKDLGIDLYWLNFVLSGEMGINYRTYVGLEPFKGIPQDDELRKTMIKEAAASLTARGVFPSMRNVAAALGFGFDTEKLRQWRKAGGTIDYDTAWEALGVRVAPRGSITATQSITDMMNDEEFLLNIKIISSNLKLAGIRPTINTVRETIGGVGKRFYDRYQGLSKSRGYTNEMMGIQLENAGFLYDEVLSALDQAVPELNGEGIEPTIMNLDKWFREKRPDLYKKGWLIHPIDAYSRLQQKGVIIVGKISQEPAGRAMKMWGTQPAGAIAPEKRARWTEKVQKGEFQWRTVSLNGQDKTVKTIYSDPDDQYNGQMPKGAYAHHFEHNGELVIVLMPGLNTDEKNESIVHEYVDYNEGHVVASAKQSILFGFNRGGISPMHQRMLRDSTINDLQALLDETDRSAQHDEILQAFIREKGEIDGKAEFEKYKSYEQMLREKVKEELAGRFAVPVFDGIEMSVLKDPQTRPEQIEKIRQAVVTKVMEAFRSTGETEGALGYEISQLTSAAVDSVIERFDGLVYNRSDQENYFKEAKIALTFKRVENSGAFTVTLSDAGVGLSYKLLRRLLNMSDHRSPGERDLEENAMHDDRLPEELFLGKEANAQRTLTILGRMLGASKKYNSWNEIAVVSKTPWSDQAYRATTGLDGQPAVNVDNSIAFDSGTTITITGRSLKSPALQKPAESGEKSQTPGGIDMNPNALNLKTDGEEIQINKPFDPAQWENLPIEGFIPVILQINTTNLPVFLGAQETDPVVQLSSV